MNQNQNEQANTTGTNPNSVTLSAAIMDHNAANFIDAPDIIDAEGVQDITPADDAPEQAPDIDAAEEAAPFTPTAAQLEAAGKKWASTDGPRRTKKIADLIGALRWAGKEKVVLSGVIGRDEYRTTQTELFSSKPLSPAFYEAIETIGNRYGYTISPANYEALLADLTAAVEQVKAARPVVDERRTPEQDAERARKFTEQAAAQRAATAEREAAEAIARRDLAEKFPYLEQAQQSRRSNHALAGHNIRLLLAHHFPGLQVRAKTETFAGGDSCDVYYTDGPTEKEVNDLIGRFSEGSFDGMTDMYNYSGDVWHGIFGGVKYLFTHRNLTPGAYHKAAEAAGIAAERVHLITSEIDGFSRPDTQKMDNWDSRRLSDEIQKTSFYVRPAVSAAPAPVSSAPITAGEATITRNEAKGGLEIAFPSKPAPEILAALHEKGWRWSRFNKVWYKRHSEAAEAEAREIVGQAAPVEA